MCIIQDFKKHFNSVTKKCVTKDYNYLMIVMNSVIDYSLSGLLVLHKLKHFLCGLSKIFREKSM